MESTFSPSDLKKAKRALSRYKTGIHKPFELMGEKVEISSFWFNEQECISIRVEHPNNIGSFATPWGYKHIRIIRSIRDTGKNILRTEYGIDDVTPEDICCAVSMITVSEIHNS